MTCYDLQQSTNTAKLKFYPFYQIDKVKEIGRNNATRTKVAKAEFFYPASHPTGRSSNSPSCSMPQKPELSASLMGQLTHEQT